MSNIPKLQAEYIWCEYLHDLRFDCAFYEIRPWWRKINRKRNKLMNEQAAHVARVEKALMHDNPNQLEEALHGEAAQEYYKLRNACN